MSTECRDERITSLNLSKLKLCKGYCGEILECKKENDVIVNFWNKQTNSKWLNEAELEEIVNNSKDSKFNNDSSQSYDADMSENLNRPICSENEEHC